MAAIPPAPGPVTGNDGCDTGGAVVGAGVALVVGVGFGVTDADGVAVAVGVGVALADGCGVAVLVGVGRGVVHGSHGGGGHLCHTGQSSPRRCSHTYQ